MLQLLRQPTVDEMGNYGSMPSGVTEERPNGIWLETHGWHTPAEDFLPGDPRGEDFTEEQKLRNAIDGAKFNQEVWEKAKEERAAERAAYLSSDKGRADAAARFEAAIISLDDIEDPEPIIEGFLYRDTLVRTFGPPKSLKSFVTLDMAACVSLGVPWQGNPTVQSKVLYVVAEGGRGIRKRRDAWNEYHETKMEVIFYTKAVQIKNRTEMHDLISFCIVKEIEYVIFDTQARCTVGVVENDNTEMGEIVAALDILKQQTGACVHLVHHSVGNDADKARGATAIDGALDSEFAVKRDRATGRLKLVSKFQKDIGEADDVLMKTLEVGLSLVMEPDSGAGASDDDSIPVISDGMMVYLNVANDYPITGALQGELVTKTGRDKGTVSRAVNKLGRDGLMEQNGTRWKLTDLGYAVLRKHSRMAPEARAEHTQTKIE